MKGHAIRIELLQWHKAEGQDASFRQIKSRYVGSFSSGTGERTYGKLDRLLDRILLEMRPTKSRKRKRS